MYEVIAIVLGAALVGLGISVALRRRRPAGEEPAKEPSSLVRVLSTEDEVRDAVVRATQFEEAAAALIDARTRRYRTLAGPSAATRLHALHTSDADAEVPPRSA